MARLGDVCIINPKAPAIDDNLMVSFIPMPKVGENGEFDGQGTATRGEAAAVIFRFKDGE